MKEKAEHTARRAGGRPSRQRAEQIGAQILDVAAEMFFSQGYGSTSIEAIVGRAHISKRTFYARFKDKADVFRAVVHRVIERLRPASMEGLFEGGTCEVILHRLAAIILRASLTPQALYLHRLILAESGRFPELALAMNAQGARAEAVKLIAGILQDETKACRLEIDKPEFAAEQFLQMITSIPLRRALGLGEAMTERELEVWTKDTVALFLNGCRGR
ncbi:MAG: TetR/AcrR family transcriptional regulator [Alphaproteobacteria bacterium]|nr:TetR/AcrR family transcriptional regulator [Alphaproteobacteria bacterium]